MSDAEQLDKDLREYLVKEPNMRRADRLVYLQILMRKHLEFSKLEHVVNSGDLFEILSVAKNNYTRMPNPVMITTKQAAPGELIHISVIESFISYLNKMNLLKKLVKFDYTDDANEFETHD